MESISRMPEYLIPCRIIITAPPDLPRLHLTNAPHPDATTIMEYEGFGNQGVIVGVEGDEVYEYS